MTPRALIPLLAVAGLGCSGPTVPLSIAFPSQEAFVVTTEIDVLAVPLDSNLDQCATLLGQAIAGTDVHPSLSQTFTSPCDVFHGAPVSDPGSGPHAFIVLGRANNRVILAGCRVAEAYPGGPTIEVQVFPTDDYQDAYTAAHPAPTATAAARCGGST